MRTLQRIRQLGADQTEMERDLLRLFEKRLSIPVDELAESIDTVKKLISSGQLHVEATTYPWGTEFRVCRSLGTGNHVSMEAPVRPGKSTPAQPLPSSVIIGRSSVEVPTSRLNEVSKIVQEHHEREAFAARMISFVRRA